MVKQTRSKKIENNNVGKGKVTPMQVAFIVDRYLADNKFTETRSIFRDEASSFLAKTSLHEAPKSLLTLGDMLDEYITLKEQKVILDQEKFQFEQEKCRVQNLLQGMQDLMTAYNSSAGCLTPPQSQPLPSSMPQYMAGKSIVSSPAGYPAYGNPMITSAMPNNKRVAPASFSTSKTIIGPPRKRRCFKAVSDTNQTAKKPCGPLPKNQLPDKGTNAVSQQSEHEANRQDSPQQCSVPQSSPHHCVPQVSPTPGKNVAKNLFNQPSQSPGASNSSAPKTPLQPISSQSDKSITPHEEISSAANSNYTHHISQDTTPTNCTIISSKTIISSPDKRVSIVRNHCTFSSPVKMNSSNRQGKRESIKGRLDFDCSDVPMCSKNDVLGTSTSSESEKEGDIFDIDLPDLDVFGPDFCLQDLLSDIDIDGFDYTCDAIAGASIDAVPGSSCEPNDGNTRANNQDLVDRS